MIGNKCVNKYTKYVDKIFEKNKIQNIVDEIAQPKITVIVPCYNVEKYVIQCLETLVKQTFKNIEIICIDDGSTDCTNEILSRFCQHDKRIKIVTQQNSGVSVARNKGLMLAKGEYISFIDSDDWIDENYFENLLSAIERNNCDIAATTIIRKRKYFQKNRVHYTKEIVYKTLQEKINICKIPQCCYTVNKLYKKNLIKNNYFEEGKFFEDVLWLPKILKKADKLVTVTNTSYYYRVTKGSIVKTTSKRKQNDSYNAKKFIINFFDENDLILPKKQRIITKEIRYIWGIPWLKIKEFKDTQTFYLFNFFPILKIKNNNLNILNILKYKNIDNHHIFSIFGIIIRKKYKNYIPDNRIASSYGLNTKQRDIKIIISLTTFPDRINEVAIVINQLLTQTLKPDKLILWLAYEQFPNKEYNLPKKLLNLKEFGLEIRWCEDLRSYKKLIPTLKEFPNDIIVTYDDDIYYPADSLKNLYNAYLKKQNCICTHRYSKVYFENNNLKFFNSKKNIFDNSTKTNSSYFNTIIGCGGVLYPPNSLNKEVLNIKKLLKLSSTQDDIWFWAMAVLNHTQIKVVDGFDTNLFTVENTQQSGLCKINCKKNIGMSGQEALNNILKEYPQIISIIKESNNV